MVVLCYLEGLTYDAAGQRLGLSEGSVRGRLARARDLLRRRLTRRGVTIPAGLLAAGTIAQGHAQAALSVPVPVSLVDSTIRMTLGFKAGEAAAALARGVLKSMLISKLKTAVAVLVARPGEQSHGLAYLRGARRWQGSIGTETPAASRGIRAESQTASR